MALWVPGAKCDLKPVLKPGGTFVYEEAHPTFAKATVFPATGPGSPIILCFSEGGWHEQKMNTVENVASQLQNSGYCAMSVQIGVDAGTEAGGQHDPAQPPAFPRQFEEVRNAVLWAKEHAAEFNGSAARIGFVGGSAGAHVVAIAAMLLNKEHGANYIKGSASLSGLFNFRTLIPEGIAGEFNTLSTKNAMNHTLKEQEEWVAGTLAEPKKAEIDAFCAAWSPELQIDKTTCPPMYIAWSELEKIIPPSQPANFATALEAAGVVTAKHMNVGIGSHAFAYWSKVKEEVVNFLKAHV